MRDLDPYEFIERLGSQDTIDSVKIIHDTLPGNIRITRASIAISNSEFGNVTLPAINFNQVTITNCNFDRLVFSQEASIGYLEIVQCKINTLQLSDLFQVIHKCSIINSGIEEILIDNTKKPSNQGLSFELSNVKFVKGLFAGNCRSISIENSDPDLNSFCRNELSILDKLDSINIKDAKFDKIFIESNGRLVHLENVEIRQRLTSSGGVTFLNLINCRGADAILKGFNQSQLSGVAFASIKVDSSFEKLDFAVAGKTNCEVNRLDLSSISGKLSIVSTRIKTLILNGSTFREARFRFVIIDNALHIENADMEMSTIYNVDFSKAEIRFLNASLSKSELINVEWDRFYEFSAELNFKKNVQDKLDILNPLRESYRQIKVLLLNQHNKIDALRFQKFELEIYYKIVSTKFKQNLNPFERTFMKGFSDWFILFTNKWSSDFGLKWTLPLFWIVIIHSSLLCIMFNYVDFGLKCSVCDADWNSTVIGFSMWWRLLNPINFTLAKMTTKEVIEYDMAVYVIIDILMRIINAYLLYHFIRATRKFNLSLNQ